MQSTAESQCDRVLKCVRACNALTIMHHLQVASAEFLQDFTREAKSSSRAAKNAICVGLLAVGISLAQMAYSEFWRSRQDGAAMDAAVANVRADIGDVIETMRAGAQHDGAAQRALSDLLEQQRKHDLLVMETLATIVASMAESSE